MQPLVPHFSSTFFAVKELKNGATTFALWRQMTSVSVTLARGFEGLFYVLATPFQWLQWSTNICCCLLPQLSFPLLLAGKALAKLVLLYQLTK